MDSYKRTDKKTNTQNNNIESAATGSFAASKIQALVRGVQYSQKERKEKTKKALEKYSNLMPQSTISNLMKPNEDFMGGYEYHLKKIREERIQRAINNAKKLPIYYDLARN